MCDRPWGWMGWMGAGVELTLCCVDAILLASSSTLFESEKFD